LVHVASDSDDGVEDEAAAVAAVRSGRGAQVRIVVGRAAAVAAQVEVRVPGAVAANDTPPATARYGFFFSETLCPARGLVMVTDDVAPAATPVTSAEAATNRAATRQTPVFNVDLLGSTRRCNSGGRGFAPARNIPVER